MRRPEVTERVTSRFEADFDELGVLGVGGFGTVVKCRRKDGGEIVAVKKLKQRFASFAEVLELKEVKSLRRMKHENIIRLLQVLRDEDGSLYLVFELANGGSLLDTMHQLPRPFYEKEVRFIAIQVFDGLKHIHRQGFLHRDIKPENYLWVDGNMKLSDFGLAREIRGNPPYTRYIATRYYRAPEMLLQGNHNAPVDLWAAGCLLAELVLQRPLFQGASEIDQLYKILDITGSPSRMNWPDGLRLASSHGIKLPSCEAKSLRSLFPSCSPQFVDLLENLLRLDPARRLTATTARQHPFLTGEALSPLVGASHAAAAQLHGTKVGVVSVASETRLHKTAGHPYNTAEPINSPTSDMHRINVPRQSITDEEFDDILNNALHGVFD